MAGSAVRTFSCPACGGQVALRAAGHTVSAICEHCSTVIDTANENFSIIKKSRERTLDTVLPLGAKGILQGVKWEVIGYMEKKDLAYGVYWDEYLLFNPYFGFRFLVQADDHWNLARVIKQSVAGVGRDSEVTLEREKFQVFNRGRSSVEYVKGEFYWRVHKGDQEEYADYIAPPRMLSMERSADEMTLSVSDYLLPQEVAQAFGVTLPRRQGIAPNQPRPFARSLSGVWALAVAACVLAFLIQSRTGSERMLQGAVIHIDPVAASKSYSTAVFTVPSRANVVVEGIAPLQNNWMDLDLTLVNDASNDAYEATQSLEYYSGVDDGEGWSEGSSSGETYFSSVAAGNYRVVLEPAVGQMAPNGMDIRLIVRHNVPAWGNFWLAVLGLLAFPVYAALYRWYFEYRRWSNSDYAPSAYRISKNDD
jgi:Domain of unknown function (DUF4178)